MCQQTTHMFKFILFTHVTLTFLQHDVGIYPATKMSFWMKHWDIYLLFQWQQVRMFLMRCWDISIRVCGDKKQVFEAKRIRGFSETIF